MLFYVILLSVGVIQRSASITGDAAYWFNLPELRDIHFSRGNV